MNAFATGSRVYGNPTDKSYFDFCILVAKDDWVTWELLWAASGDISPKYPRSCASFKFGNLNIIAFEDEGAFNAWHEATKELSKLPERASRKVAIALIQEKLREQKKQGKENAVAAGTAQEAARRAPDGAEVKSGGWASPDAAGS